MKPKFRGETESKGAFRVSNHELFQKERPVDEEFSKKIGTNHPSGDRTTMKVKELRYFAMSDDPSPRTAKLISGRVMLKCDRFGEWSGRFIDEHGRHWDFKCSRVAE